MKNILIIGAGKSSSSLITYLLDNSFQEDLQITIADILIENALKLINHHSRGQAIVLDIFDKKKNVKKKLKKQIWSFQCFLQIYILKLQKIVFF